MIEKTYVTRAFLPPRDEFNSYVDQIWDSKFLTNQGPLLQQFEEQITTYLGIDRKSFHFVTNGTLALQLAIHSLDLADSEVITTPFSYVATISAILWEKAVPVFVDIDPQTLCINPNKIEEKITSKTKAIVATHVFGVPCDIDAIEKIGQKHHLKVIYDAAHCFGVTYKNKPIFSYGDISIGSFHATKVFHTIEGGCIVVNEPSLYGKIELKKRFGHHGDEHLMLGINAKASEFQAAMGLCNLKYVAENIEKRRRLAHVYDNGLRQKFQTIITHTSEVIPNYSYYPIIFKSAKQREDILERLEGENIFPRRYFYPSLNTLPYLPKSYNCPVSEDIADRILCLPLYPDLDPKITEKIISIICEV